MQNHTTTQWDQTKLKGLMSEYKVKPEKLMSILLKTQSLCGNGISEETASMISHETGIPKCELFDYLSFYSMFSNEERGKYIIRMCKSAPCHISGASEILAAIKDYLKVEPGETTEDGLFTLELCECIGLCDASPALMINDSVYDDLTPDKIRRILSQYKEG